MFVFEKLKAEGCFEYHWQNDFLGSIALNDTILDKFTAQSMLARQTNTPQQCLNADFENDLASAYIYRGVMRKFAPDPPSVCFYINSERTVPFPQKISRRHRSCETAGY